jgi:hypothetical protein
MSILNFYCYRYFSQSIDIMNRILYLNKRLRLDASGTQNVPSKRFAKYSKERN